MGARKRILKGTVPSKPKKKSPMQYNATGTPTFAFAPDRRFGPAMTKISDSRRLLVGAWVWGDYKSRAEAARAAGYMGHEGARDAFAHPDVREAIYEETLARIASGAPKSIRVIEALQDNAKAEKVKLDAAKHLSGLAGHVQKQQVEIKHTHTLEDLSAEELDKKIAEMQARMYPQIGSKTSSVDGIYTSTDDSAIDAEFTETEETV